MLGASGIDELSNGNIIVSGFNSLVEVDPATLSEVNDFNFSASLNKFSITSSGFYSISTHGGIASHFDNGLQLLDYKNIGKTGYEYVLILKTEKDIRHSNSRNDYSSVYIYDENNNLLNSIDLYSRLQSIKYHGGIARTFWIP
ncbi:MAG: hypothetical protein U5L09_07675 [Bacteroidales bacterium]|nr:hypothetical protein [Bacteroidales bacterium]